MEYFKLRIDNVAEHESIRENEEVRSLVEWFPIPKHYIRWVTAPRTAARLTPLAIKARLKTGAGPYIVR